MSCIQKWRHDRSRFLRLALLSDEERSSFEQTVTDKSVMGRRSEPGFP